MTEKYDAAVSAAMRERIKETLAQIEKTHRVKVLYACESGSRGWGFASPDSDYDVRFIYVHQPDWYLALDKKRDVIEKPIDDELDVAGWELSKALRLLRNSNPALIEWLSSPVVYYQDDAFTREIKALAEQFYSVRKARYHYLSMAKRNTQEHLLAEQIRLKKYFYVLRPVMALCWIAAGKGLPPMAFDALVAGTITDADVLAEIEELLILKKSSGESHYGTRRPAVDRLIQDVLNEAERSLPEVPYYHDCRLLDRFLMKTVTAYTDTSYTEHARA
ncbi:nucleotidyltransferase [Morganella morganii]|uniref:nucleotidyltransferase domain-containing protein n=1 Tax=Morganella morganii TaxID=582 RepID=UPI0006C06595|nr:nucleotidyltransferase domain-containing protein [Morganella morganii]KOO19003.1 nucleotidyltransferase [Morganella morganii]HEI9872923.1 nucleotidyltransferase domain-containing protein [Morganella morganii]